MGPDSGLGLVAGEGERLVCNEVLTGLGMISPSNVRGEPYTISAKEQRSSSLGTVLIPRTTHGSSCVQLG